MKKYDVILDELVRRAKKSSVLPNQIEKIKEYLFPPLPVIQDRSHISPNWKSAFTLLELAQLEKSNQAIQKNVMKYLLENCMFPLSCWDNSLRIFSELCNVKFTDTNHNLSAVRNLGPNGLLQVILFLSMSGRTKMGWEYSLLCYNSLTNKNHGVSQMNLKSARHHVLITLLNNHRWIEALKMYQHIIAQKEFPSPTATGFLIWRLGEASRWVETLSIYDLSVRYLERKHLSADSNALKKLRKEWGTVFSMAIECSSRANPLVIRSMINKLIEYNKKLHTKPVALLDGNFIRSIERLRKEDSKELFSIADRHDFLDHYKIIRGLVSRKRWIDALRSFIVVMKRMSKDTEYPGLSRSEIGKARLSLLHSATHANVRNIVECINSLRTNGGRYTLNDSEIECIFSKSIDNNEPTFWLYSLEVFAANFTFSDKKNKKNRLPTNAMISLLLHDQYLPWQHGLRIFSRWSLNSSRSERTQKNSTENNILSVATNALLKLLYDNNINSDAERIILSMAQDRSISLPAVFLQNSSEEVLRCAIQKNPQISSKTLFYILQQSQSQKETKRALLCLHLYLHTTFGIGFLAENNGHNENNNVIKTFKIVSVVPASVHVECIRCIGRSGLSNREKIDLAKAYLNVLLCPHSCEAPPLHARDSLYCVVYETIVIFLDEPPFPVTEQNNDEYIARFLLELLEVVLTRYHCIPPFYMFLPNQLDRLLPRSTSRLQQKVSEMHARCSIAKELISLILQISDKKIIESPSRPLINGLLKLCCRVLEFEEKMPKDRPAIFFEQQKIDLAQSALKIIEWEGRSYGMNQISLANLFLLYRTIALSSRGNTYLPKVLEITASVLPSASTPEKGGSPIQVRPKQGSFKLYTEFSHLFGWEVGLGLWYQYFPREVLKNLSTNCAAVDYCLSLPIKYD